MSHVQSCQKFSQKPLVVSGIFSDRSKNLEWFSGFLKLVVATKPLNNTKFSDLVVYNLDMTHIDSYIWLLGQAWRGRKRGKPSKIVKICYLPWFNAVCLVTKLWVEAGKSIGRDIQNRRYEPFLLKSFHKLRKVFKLTLTLYRPQSKYGTTQDSKSVSEVLRIDGVIHLKGRKPYI